MKTRILVVDDSLPVRKHIIDVLNDDPDLEIVGEASDGRTALELVPTLRPDVITLDMVLPVMSGVAVTEYVMAYFPTPILVVSASTNRGALFRTYDALAAGALDVLEKPPVASGGERWERRLVSAVKRAARIRVIRHPRARLRSLEDPKGRQAHGADARLCAIGASTGGPAALLTLLKALPADFRLPILAVLHISEPFAQGLAAWLDGEATMPVRLARDREPVPPLGTPQVLLAPSGYHLELDGSELRLTEGPERNSCRPSVDVLFETIAHHLGRRAIACLMTGMGRDGAAGLLAVRRAGGVTLAQDEGTSVVYGMPREAAERDAADMILPLDEFASALVELTTSSKGNDS